MNIVFDKYSANGNDFILVDNRSLMWKPAPELVAKLCARRTGIGADGIVLLENSSKADFKMVIYNSDGSKPEMCGNAARSIVDYAAKHLKLKNQTAFSFETEKSIYQGKMDGEEVCVTMSEKYDEGRYTLDHFPFPVLHAYYVNTGVPHAVFHVPDFNRVDVVGHGRLVRQDPRFERGTNVDFFELVDKNKQHVRLRIYERGVEGETLCCGTGVMATALACQKFWGFEGEVIVETLGGKLKAVLLDNSMEYKGRVDHIYRGEFTA